MTTPWDDRFEPVLRPHLKPYSQQLEPDDRLFALGLDSLAVVQLATDIEDAYDVILPDEALTPETFATPGGLWATLQPLLP